MTSPWLERRVIAFAHQGGAFEGPSSTLFAIDHALAQGASAIELDVHATADRQLVVCHDAVVDRTTAHHGAIADLTLAELGEMDNAYWWAPGALATPGLAAEAYVHRGKAPAERQFGIATLEEVVSRFPGVLLNLDIKGTAPDVEPYEQLLAHELRRLDCAHAVIVASFHDVAIQSFRAAAPGVATSAATGEVAAFYFSLEDRATPVVAPVAALQVPARHGDIELVTEAFVDAAHRAGVAVHVWTLNDVHEMTRVLDLGVDGIMSDTPTSLAQLLEERHCAWDGAL